VRGAGGVSANAAALRKHVIPAKAGIQCLEALDSGSRRCAPRPE
jgi:hypothetical protein